VQVMRRRQFGRDALFLFGYHLSLVFFDYIIYLEPSILSSRFLFLLVYCSVGSTDSVAGAIPL
jgi:hypothetical protein